MRAQASTTLALPIDAAWQRLADLSALSQWAPDVAGSPAEPLRSGGTRWARLYEPVYGKDVLIERFTDVDPRRHTFTYDIEDGIGPLRSIRTTWALDVDGARTRVTVHSDLEVGGLARLVAGVVRRAWAKQLQSLVEGFARWADATAGELEVLPDTAIAVAESAPKAPRKRRAPKRATKAAVAGASAGSPVQAKAGKPVRKARTAKRAAPPAATGLLQQEAPAQA